MSRMFLLLNPPDHTRLRRIVAPAFTNSAVAALRPMVVDTAARLVPSHAAEVDLVSEVAYPLPLLVITALLGVPEPDAAQFAEWSRVLTQSLDDPIPTKLRELPAAMRGIAARRSHPVAALRAVNGIVRYSRGAVQRAFADPPSDLVVRLRDAVRGGEMNDDEAVATWILFAIAGHETTANLIGNAVLALLLQPAALAQVRARPDLLPAAVDELLRYDSPVPHTPRVASEDVALDGIELLAVRPRCCSWPPRTAIRRPSPIPTTSPSIGRSHRRTSASRTASTSVRAPPWPASKPRWR